MSTPRRNEPVHRYALCDQVVYRGQHAEVRARLFNKPIYDLLLPSGSIKSNVSEDEISGEAA